MARFRGSNWKKSSFRYLFKHTGKELEKREYAPGNMDSKPT